MVGTGALVALRGQCVLRQRKGCRPLPRGRTSPFLVGAVQSAPRQQRRLFVDGQDDYAVAVAAFATGLFFLAAALRTAAQRLRVASMIALRPAALSLRFFGAAVSNHARSEFALTTQWADFFGSPADFEKIPAG